MSASAVAQLQALFPSLPAAVAGQILAACKGDGQSSRTALHITHTRGGGEQRKRWSMLPSSSQRMHGQTDSDARAATSQCPQQLRPAELASITQSAQPRIRCRKPA
jgi:hypothetical protein